ncbi:hypothetical protein LEP1GSC108_2302 [Leptospira weilii str. UI 13098]|uniref:Uncharacterized protein n=1 Tax=Leptospira weilii str. UI 13098 TaxID=1088542 RepID=M6QDN8_9LEPT|nr:hypothetical protein LEP1GSC108_2302 [Leptospira weilii str. UI 13098]
MPKKLRIVADYKVTFELFFRLIKSASQNLGEWIVFYCLLLGGCNSKTGFGKCV